MASGKSATKPGHDFNAWDTQAAEENQLPQSCPLTSTNLHEKPPKASSHYPTMHHKINKTLKQGKWELSEMSGQPTYVVLVCVHMCGYTHGSGNRLTLVNQAGTELMAILLPQLLKSWDSKHEPPHQVL